MESIKTITIQAVVHAAAEKVWEYYNGPEHITRWNHASEDWHTPQAENDLKPGGEFHYQMETKDGSAGFDFWGTYPIELQRNGWQVILDNFKKYAEAKIHENV